MHFNLGIKLSLNEIINAPPNNHSQFHYSIILAASTIITRSIYLSSCHITGVCVCGWEWCDLGVYSYITMRMLHYSSSHYNIHAATLMSIHITAILLFHTAPIMSLHAEAIISLHVAAIMSLHAAEIMPLKVTAPCTQR